ncbi:MAG: hypothetical protein HZB47_09430 [Nitrosomonadales bacterium]|nr:hypothetical protein [Nitrosomonadales bacterium]
MRPLLLTLVFAVAFVLVTGRSLPPVVASHFIAGGAANGFVPRDTYMHLTVALLVALPLLISLLTSIGSMLPARFINLPNREYWLAPERQADTLAYLRKHSSRFSFFLAVFICFVHWLVVKANEQNPPLLPEPLLFSGMAAFLVGLVVWLGGFVVHFRRP